MIVPSTDISIEAADGATPSPESAGATPAHYWLRYATVAFLLIACYAPILIRLGQSWTASIYMYYGFAVPIMSGLMIWYKRRDLAAIQHNTNLWGLAAVIAGGIMACAGPPGLYTFNAISRGAFMLSLLGAILFVRGWQTIRCLAYPLAMLLLMAVPVFAVNHFFVTPLRLVAIRFGELLLDFLGITAFRNGSVVYILNSAYPAPVAHIGIHLQAFLTFTFITASYAYFAERRAMIRLALLVTTVPVMILGGIGEIVLAGLVTRPAFEYVQRRPYIVECVIMILTLCSLPIIHRLFTRLYPSGHSQ